MTSSSEGVDSLGTVVSISIICVLAVFFNITVIIVTWRKPQAQRNSTSLFIVNLAVSDIILGGVTMPLILMDANIPDFTRYDTECKMKMALPLFNVYSSVLTMVLMSYDRQRVIVKGKEISRQQAILAVLVIWVLSLVLTAPQFYEYRVVNKGKGADNHTELACSSTGRDPTFLQTYACLVLIAAYLLPLVLLTKNYLHIAIYILGKARLIQGHVSRAKILVLRTVIIVTVVFVVLWLPFFILFAIEEVTGTDDSSLFSSTPHVIKQLFAALSALSNPVVYFSLIGEYRQALQRLFCSTCSCVNKVFPNEVFNTSSEERSAREVPATDATPFAASVGCSGPARHHEDELVCREVWSTSIRMETYPGSPVMGVKEDGVQTHPERCMEPRSAVLLGD